MSLTLDKKEKRVCELLEGYGEVIDYCMKKYSVLVKKRERFPWGMSHKTSYEMGQRKALSDVIEFIRRKI